jgi:hypothetical protein
MAFSAWCVPLAVRSSGVRHVTAKQQLLLQQRDDDFYAVRVEILQAGHLVGS